jgi:hypothetical protein
MENEKLSKNANKFCCKSCYFYTSNNYDYNKHLLTRKHINRNQNTTLEMNGKTKIVSKNANYTCNICNYYSNNKSNYDKHLVTEKHKKYILKDVHNTTINCSNCNKEFNTQSGLWKHKKKCVVMSNEREPETIQNKFTPTITPELFLEVIRESKELQNVLIEQNKELQIKLLEQNKLHKEEILELAKNQSIVNNNNNTTNNTNNNQFNLQFFLNETCKDAMNIVDFINSLQLTTDDFETTGKLGFVDGISRIFIKELKKLNTEKLPIHCTDLKRETVYIKDNDKWEKENNEKQKLKWTIDKIAQLNLHQLQKWQEKYPVCIENNTKENEYFFKLAAVALGGRGEDEQDKYRDKIMRNVLKEVVLDKQTLYNRLV